MPQKVLSGRELVWKINHEKWFYHPKDENSLVTDAKFKKGILSYVWAGFNECHESSYQFTRAFQRNGRINVFANISFLRLDSTGLNRNNQETLVLTLYDLSHFSKLVKKQKKSRS